MRLISTGLKPVALQRSLVKASLILPKNGYMFLAIVRNNNFPLFKPAIVNLLKHLGRQKIRWEAQKPIWDKSLRFRL